MCVGHCRRGSASATPAAASSKRSTTAWTSRWRVRSWETNYYFPWHLGARIVSWAALALQLGSHPVHALRGGAIWIACCCAASCAWVQWPQQHARLGHPLSCPALPLFHVPLAPELARPHLPFPQSAASRSTTPCSSRVSRRHSGSVGHCIPARGAGYFHAKHTHLGGPIPHRHLAAQQDTLCPPLGQPAALNGSTLQWWRTCWRAAWRWRAMAPSACLWR